MKQVIFLLLALSFAKPSVRAQTKEATLTVEGEVKTKLVLSPADLALMPQITIKAKDHQNREHTYQGTELALVLKQAGVTLAEELKGENLSKYLLAEASDGYQVLFSLAEIDTAFTSRKIILAWKKDGAVLSADEGPFRIIIDGEKRMPRNARQVVSLKVKFAQ